MHLLLLLLLHIYITQQKATRNRTNLYLNHDPYPKRRMIFVDLESGFWSLEANEIKGHGVRFYRDFFDAIERERERGFSR